MPKVIEPLYSGELGKGTLSFFKAPSFEPQLPWHDFNAMLVCLGYPRDLRRSFLTRLKADWSGNTQTAATSKGIVTIAPHWVAQGLIGSAKDLGFAPKSFEFDYIKIASKAMEILTNGMNQEDALIYSMNAAKNTLCQQFN